MAIGDIDGDLPATKNTRQMSFDQTNLPAQYQTNGPVARASQQLAGQPASLSQVGAAPQPASTSAAAATVSPAPASLSQLGASAQTSPSTLTQPNLNQPATPSFPGQPQQPGQSPSFFDAQSNAAALAQPLVSLPPSLSSSTAPTTTAASASQPASQSGAVPTLNGYQPTGIGADRQGGQIVGRVGADGVPEFTNSQSAQQQAAGQPTLNGFGSGGNFSVGAPGDAARAMAGYQQLHDMRQQWANEDRLDNALAQNTRNNNFTVVHDSSRSLSVQDKQTDASLEQMRANSLQNAQAAQGVYDDSVQRLGAQQQLRQASRLEDLQAAAMAPGAPDSARAALQQAMDPTGEKAANRQLTAAKTAQANAAAAKDNQVAANGGKKVGNLPVGLQKLEDGDLEALANVKSMDTQLGNISNQIDNGALKLSAGGNLWNKALNYAGTSTQESANYASFQAAMEKMRNDSLRLNKGTQTEGDAVRAWNELFASANDPKVVRQRLGEIQALNAQAAKVRTGMINSRRKNQGIGTLDVDDVLNGTIGLQPGQGAPQQDQQPQQTQPQGQQLRSAQNAAPLQIQNDADFAKLPSGAIFIDPQGNHRRKP